MLRKLLSLFLLAFFYTLTSYAEEENLHPKRVYVDACADLMHAGHVEFFKNARALGDYLIVGLHSDDVIASYKRIPILTLEERVAIVQACKYVDQVIPGAPLEITEEWIKQHQIDLVVHGDDLNPETVHQWYKVPIEQGIFKTVPYTKGISTTEIIERIINRYFLLSPP